MKQKAFTLIEILITLSLILILSSACIFNMNTLLNNKIKLQDKIENYNSLCRYAQSFAEQNGKNTEILVESNKINVLMENSDNWINIPTLQYQIDNLNDNSEFNSSNTIVATYFPDGFVQNDNNIALNLDEDKTNMVILSIDEFNRINIVYTNIINQ